MGRGKGLWAEGLGPARSVWSALLKAVWWGDGETARLTKKPYLMVQTGTVPQT